MKQNVIIYGLISGILVSTMLVIFTSMCYTSGNFEGNMWVGYASMLLAFSLVFVGVRNYRDKFLDGHISLGQAFKMGLYMVLIASTFYVVVWQICFYFFIPDFGEKYAAQVISKLQTSGASATEIDVKTREMADFTNMYKNPLFNVLITYAEILPVGLIVNLLSSIILKRKLKAAL